MQETLTDAGTNVQLQVHRGAIVGAGKGACACVMYIEVQVCCN